MRNIIKLYLILNNALSITANWVKLQCLMARYSQNIRTTE
ncbi:hypothetical protein NEICINOT_04486 [Neisseria cinerea ATCC 14685]|uniref:Uncharacterized protein n=1 Tax=Neisseria cinerea ATCC 14685 TaxID=546262 RepID=D0W490_NEICI|nr:hypothetical protein NEICINOT_04486 [Neisseria cinerea ATCC 14685]